MKTVKTIAATLLLTALSSAPALAANAENGKKLYTERCGGCHDTKVHTRPNRIVHTYEDLVNRVRFCDNAAKAGLKDGFRHLLQVTVVITGLLSWRDFITRHSSLLFQIGMVKLSKSRG